MQERPAEFGPGWDGIDPFRTLASLDKQENEARMKEFKEYAQDRMGPGTIDALFHADPDDSHDDQ